MGQISNLTADFTWLQRHNAGGSMRWQIDTPDGKAGDAAAVSEVIRPHRGHLDARVTRLRGALHRIDHLLAEGLATVMSELDTSSDMATTKSPPGTGSVTDAALPAAQLFNQTWRLMEQEGWTRGRR